jgi:hypothetical protein
VAVLPLPAVRLPLPRRRLGAGAIVAIVAHVLVLGGVLWERSAYLRESVGEQGPRGGGGTGDDLVSFVSLPRPAAPAAAAVPDARASVTPTPVIPPLTTTLHMPQLAVAAQPPTLTGVAGGGTSASPGTGGGTGGGDGTGAGTHTGPGSGGDGGYISIAFLEGMPLPPECARGQFTVLFSVEADGRLTKVDIDPLPKDAECRREFFAKMWEYKFKPARTRDGRPIASVYPVKIGK